MTRSLAFTFLKSLFVFKKDRAEVREDSNAAIMSDPFQELIDAYWFWSKNKLGSYIFLPWLRESVQLMPSWRLGWKMDPITNFAVELKKRGYRHKRIEHEGKKIWVWVNPDYQVFTGEDN